jgi:hypothetical protein
MWVADQIALADVAFPNDAWVIRLATDSNWAYEMTAEIGYWNGDVFTPLPVNTQFNNYDNNFAVEIEFVPVGGQVIPEGTYLAFRLGFNSSNNGFVPETVGDVESHEIYTGKQLETPNGSYYYSCVTSPQSDPGYPLPELAAGVLLGAGLLAIGGFMFIRRKHAAVKA